MLRALVSLLCLCLASPTLAETTAAPAPAEVRFIGFAQNRTYDAAALTQLPRQQVEASDHGTPARFEGVALLELLRQAGAPVDKSLRGPALSQCVVVNAADGYRVVFALAEFDTEFGNAGAVLADRRDGKALDAKEGPFRLVIAREKRAGRWVRQVNQIELTHCGLGPAAAHPAH